MEHTISVAMIVKNEADKLETVLQHARLIADEIVVVDTGSTDGTVAIAEGWGAKVYHFPWCDDFAAARNEAFSRCTSDWIMWLDADDYLPPEVIRAIKNYDFPDEAVDAIWCEYRLYDNAHEKVLMTFDRERFIRRESGLKWEGRVHEVIAVPAGRGLKADNIYVEHKPTPSEGKSADRNLKILENMYYSDDRTPRTLYYYANELRDNGLWQDAIDVYDEYFPEAELDWEIYDALISKARCYSGLGGYEDKALQCAYDAIAFDSSRAEGYVLAGIGKYEKKLFDQAIPLFEAALKCKRPQFGFSTEAMYTYMPWDFLGVCYYWTGDKEMSALCTTKALNNGAPDIERLEKNLAFALE